MTTVLSHLTISGFNAFISDCDGNESVNQSITSGIYSYQAANLLDVSAPQQTIYLLNGTNRAGARTVDTLSVMALPATTSDKIIINGYTAAAGVYTKATDLANWQVWAPQVATGSTGVANNPYYTVSTPGTPAGPQTLTAISLSAAYNSNASLEVVEGRNLIVIEVWNSGLTTKRATYTYYVVIVSSSTRLSSLIPTLSPAAGYSYSPAFDSGVYCEYDNQVYTLIVDPSATDMTLTPTTTISGIESIITIITPAGPTLAPITSGSTSSSFDIADNNSLSVIVTAPDGVTTQRYVLTIQSDISGNNLSAATFSYYSTVSTTTAFDATGTSWLSGTNPSSSNLLTNTQFSYLNTIPNISYGLSVFLSAVDSGASVSIGSVVMPVSGTFLIPYSSLIQGAQNTIVCKCISSTGIVKLYNFNIWLAGSDTAPNAAGILSNISFNPSQAVFDGDNLFRASNYTTCSDLANVLTKYGTATIPIYNIYVSHTVSGAITVNLTYNDNGSRFSTKLNADAWSPLNIETTPANTTIDNWTLGSLRTVSITVPTGTLTPGSSNRLLIASHLPGSAAYYGYALQFVTPLASLNSINLSSSTTGAFINLNPSYNPILESYSAYIGTAAAPTRFVNLSVLFSGIFAVDWNITAFNDTYSASRALTSGAVPVTVTLGSSVASSYVLWIRLWNPNTTTLVGYYTLNLLNVDQSLLLSGLVVADQLAASTTTGIYPAPTPVTLTPTPFAATTFVYNAPITTQYCAIKPTVSTPSSKSISISVNGATPQPVVSGTYFIFPMSVRQIAVQITVYDNLSPTNSNSYLVLVYSNSSNLQLSLANFEGILNSDFTTPLPNGTTIISPITASGGNIDCSNAVVPSTRFTGTPFQPGTSMYLNTFVGFEPLSPGVPSSVISLNAGVQKSIPVWLYATNNVNANYFNFRITQISDTNSFLASMVLSNCSNFTFVPTTQTYTGIVLNSPFTKFTFTPTTASANASMTYTLNGSSPVAVVSGNSVTVDAPLYGASPNVLVINVAPQSGIPRTYTFNISRVANAYLSNLRVYAYASHATSSDATSTANTVQINPSPFNPLFLTYSSEVGPTIDTAYVVLSKAPEASIAMVGGSAYALNTAGEQIWTVPVQVSTTPQNTLVYSLNPATITISAGVLSNVYNLAIVRQYPVATARTIALSSGGIDIPLRNQLGVPTTFDPLVFTYTISPVYTGAVLADIVGQGSNTYYLNGLPYYVPSSVVIDSTHPIVIRVVNTDFSTSLYQFSLL